jgi:hypothetical protein
VRLFDAKTLKLLKCFDSERPLNSVRVRVRVRGEG